MRIPPTKMWTVPGGIIPHHHAGRKQKEHDVGVDLAIRAVVAIESPAEQRARKSPARRSLFDFLSKPEYEVNEKNVGKDANEKYFYRLYAGETVALGLGVVVQIPPGYAGYVQPRGSAINVAGRHCVLSVLNDSVPIDPGFRGEIWVQLRNEGPQELIIYLHDALLQLVRVKVDTSRVVVVSKYSELSRSHRGHMSNGSTNRPKRLRFTKEKIT